MAISDCPEYRTDVFDRGTIEVMLARFVRLLRVVVADPDVPVGRVELLTERERQHVLVEWNDTGATDEPGWVSVPELFALQVVRSPRSVAVEFMDEALSYAELDADSARLARLLIGHHVGPEKIVALALPRSLEMVTAVLAVLKAG